MSSRMPTAAIEYESSARAWRPEEKENIMSQKSSQTRKRDRMRPEYDFSNGVRGKYYERYRKGTNLVLLEPDVARVFRDSESVNNALRLLVSLAKDEVPSRK